MLKKKKIFLVLKPSGIKIISPDSELNSEINFDVAHLEHQEVKDAANYHQILSQMFNKLPDSEIILLLAEEFIYHKRFNKRITKDQHEEKKSFLHMVPFDELKIAYIHVIAGEKTDVIATNRNLYDPILSIAQKADKKLIHIIPLSMVYKDINSEFTYKELVKKYSYELFRSYDFKEADSWDTRIMDWDMYVREDKSFDSDSIFTPRLITGLAVLFTLIGILILTIIQNRTYPKSVILNNTVTKSPVFIPTITPTPTTAYKQLKDLRALVFNGSNKAGQAAKLKNALTEVGLTQIETGNYKDEKITDVLISLSTEISASDSALITQQINNSFPDLVLNISSTSSADFDISIIIGDKPLLE